MEVKFVLSDRIIYVSHLFDTAKVINAGIFANVFQSALPFSFLDSLHYATKCVSPQT
jgi:hypothetical protein